SDDQVLDRQLEEMDALGKAGEDRVAARGDRGGDGQDVVDQQRRAGDQARPRADQPGGDHVAAAPEGEVLDDLAVRGGDDHHRQRGGGGEGAGGILGVAGVLERSRGAEGVGGGPAASQSTQARNAASEREWNSLGSKRSFGLPRTTRRNRQKPRSRGA